MPLPIHNPLLLTRFSPNKINKEIDECNSIDTLRESLKSMAYQNARFQHMIGELLKESMLGEIADFFDKVTIEEGPAKE